MSASTEFIDTKFVTLEEFGFLYPFFEGVCWRSHGQDHGGDLFVEAHREVGDVCEFVFKLRLGSEVLKLINVVLESIIGSSIFVFAWFLKKSRYVTACFHLGVEGIKVLVIVSHKLFKCLFFRLAILSYHFSEKEMPFPVPILLRMRAILISSEE